MELMYAAALQSVPLLGANRLRLLVNFFGSFSSAWNASVDEWRAAGFTGEKLLANFETNRAKIVPEQLWERLLKLKVKVTTYQDDNYPFLLKETANPPAVLFYKGQEPIFKKTIAVIGARKSTPYGKNACRYFVKKLASEGVVIVSGGARGIDSLSHQAALPYAPTVAVLGCGLDIVYPPENKKLFDEICERGTLISEFSLGIEPLGRNFPARNRIISGMSYGVLVVEAAQKSGSLITADYALEEGRDVFAVPGSIFSDMSEGTHHLIRQGGIFASKPEDILCEYDWQIVSSPQKTAELELNDSEEFIYRLCSLEHQIDLEEIIQQSTFSLAKVNYILLKLELKGLIENIGNQRYIALKK